MRRALIVSSPNAFRMNLDLVALALEDILRRLGYDCLQLTWDARPPKVGRSGLAFFIHLSAPPQFRHVGGRRIVLNYHPVCPDGRYGTPAHRAFSTILQSHKKRWIDDVFDYNPHTTEWLKQAGINAHFCPLGYHERFDNREVEETGSDQDVLFLGNVGRRKLSTRQLSVDACGAKVITNCFGHDRIQYTRRRGVHLSLASYNKFRTCLTLRLIGLLASNARTIVHETTDWCPLEHGTHCLIGGPDELPDLVDRLKKDTVLAAKLGACARSFLVNEYRFEDHVLAALRSAGILKGE